MAAYDSGSSLRVEVEQLEELDSDIDTSAIEDERLGLLSEAPDWLRRSAAQVLLRSDRIHSIHACRREGFWMVLELWQCYLRKTVEQLQLHVERVLHRMVMDSINITSGMSFWEMMHIWTSYLHFRIENTSEKDKYMQSPPIDHLRALEKDYVSFRGSKNRLKLRRLRSSVVYH